MRKLSILLIAVVWVLWLTIPASAFAEEQPIADTANDNELSLIPIGTADENYVPLRIPETSPVGGLYVDSVAMYTDLFDIPKVKTSGRREDGRSSVAWYVPEGQPIVVMKTKSKSKYGHWWFLAYGQNMKEILSIWLTAKATGQPTFCQWFPRGNYFGECRGAGFGDGLWYPW